MPEASTLQDALEAAANVKPQGIATALNNHVVTADMRPKTVLTDGDRVVVITAFTADDRHDADSCHRNRPAPRRGRMDRHNPARRLGCSAPASPCGLAVRDASTDRECAAAISFTTTTPRAFRTDQRIQCRRAASQPTLPCPSRQLSGRSVAFMPHSRRDRRGRQPSRICHTQSGVRQHIQAGLHRCIQRL